MKVFISQGMNGLPKEKIKDINNKIKKIINSRYDNIEFIDSNFKTHQEYEQVKSYYLPVGMLGRSIQRMSEANLVVFALNYNNFRGCKIEYEVCLSYNIPYIELNEKDFLE